MHIYFKIWIKSQPFAMIFSNNKLYTVYILIEFSEEWKTRWLKRIFVRPLHKFELLSMIFVWSHLSRYVFFPIFINIYLAFFRRVLIFASIYSLLFTDTWIGLMSLIWTWVWSCSGIPPELPGWFINEADTLETDC